MKIKWFGSFIVLLVLVALFAVWGTAKADDVEFPANRIVVRVATAGKAYPFLDVGDPYLLPVNWQPPANPDVLYDKFVVAFPVDDGFMYINSSEAYLVNYGPAWVSQIPYHVNYMMPSGPPGSELWPMMFSVRPTGRVRFSKNFPAYGVLTSFTEIKLHAYRGTFTTGTDLCRAPEEMTFKECLTLFNKTN